MKFAHIVVSILLPLCGLSQAYEIPGALEQPSFIFPVWFEDANGDRDTVWLGYDPSAGISEQFDYQFNEWQQIDTSKFAVKIWPDSFSPYMTTPADSAYKSAVMSGTIDMSIGFIKGKMPITMYWDEELFKDPDLPFTAPIAPYPIGYGQIFCGAAEAGFVNCPSAFDDQPLTMTSYELPEILYPVTSPHLFDGTGEFPYETPQSALGFFSIAIKSTDLTLSGISLIEQSQILVTSNPASVSLSITNVSNAINLRMYNTVGVLMFERDIYEEAIIEITDFPHGIYFILVNESKVYKVLIL